MELLSYVAQAGKRKSRFEEKARELAKDFPTVDKLEAETARRSDALVSRLRRAKISMGEFERVAADETIISALAGVMVGDGIDTVLKDSTFASTMGALPYLWKYFREVKTALKEGRISYEAEDYADSDDNAYLLAGKSPSKYASTKLSAYDDLTQDVIDSMPLTLMSGERTGSVPATWEGMQERTRRYISTPVYRWAKTGEMAKKQRTGYKEMRRDCKSDKRSCTDCKFYASQGWMPMGVLPAPGNRCQCLDRCRCSVEFR